MRGRKRRWNTMSRDEKEEQDQNTAKLVMNAFYKVAGKDGASAAEITDYLQHKFGDVWKMSTLTWKAEETLKRSAVLGFLERQGSRFVANVARGYCRKRRPVKKKPCRRCHKKRPRPCSC
ncbi:hypothetical protein PYW07_000610 [Mythimna separata]|uniref:Uncharacterized protein n=1 Tax=Mythimna separata TaxID=271217 RepID=A0AAD7Z3W5_MYTSE|nr:hypothetical protein PYW07_000610 [Mythimna separata]